MDVNQLEAYLRTRGQVVGTRTALIELREMVLEAEKRVGHEFPGLVKDGVYIPERVAEFSAEMRRKWRQPR
jgi:hypothetical protein